MPSVADVEKALTVADSLPVGEEQVVASERALGAAEELGQHRLVVQARINLVAAYDASRPGQRELPHIAWLLGALNLDDAARRPGGDPAMTVDDRQRFEILWECRFALARTRRSSSAPLSVVHRVYVDVERRYRAETVSPQLYAKHRALLARDVDEPAVLDQWLQVWRQSPRDELSDCEACDAADDARFLADAGEHEAALERVADLLDGRGGCDVEPHLILGEAADWAMKVGRVDAAEAYHRSGWLLIAGESRFLASMAAHVMYLVRSNRVGRALRLTTGMADLLVGADVGAGAEAGFGRLEDDDRMVASAVVGRVLRAGRGHRTAPAEVAGLALDTSIANFEGVGRQLAAAFDERNGTRRVSSRRAAVTRIAAYPQLASAETLAVDALDVALGGAGADGEHRPVQPAQMGLPDTAMGYAAELLGATDRFAAPRVRKLVDGWAVHRTEMPSATNPLEHFTVAYLDRRALTSDRARAEPAFAAELLERATDSARLSGSRPAVQRMEVEAAYRAALTGDVRAWARAERAVDEIAASGELREAAGALLTLSRNPDARRGMDYALRAADLFDRAGQPRWQATALQSAGYAAIWADPSRSAELLDTAHRLAGEQSVAVVVVAVTATRAKLDWRQGRLPEAIAGYRKAAADAAEVGVPDADGLRSELCDVLLQAGEWEALIDEAHDLLHRLEPGDVVGRALAHRVLGLGLLETGNVDEAVEVLEPAATALGHAAHPMYAVTSWTLGRALLAARRPDLAGPCFEVAATGFEEQRRLPDAAAAHEAAGATLGQSEESAAAAEHLVAAARTSRHVRDVHRMVSSLRQLAGVQAASGRTTEALATLGSVIPQARAVLPADPSVGFAAPVPEVRLRGLLQHQAATILAADGRSDEAQALLKEALTTLAEHGEEPERVAAAESWQRLTGRVWPG